jgi:phosphohistidine phosphatase SixA
MSAPSEDIERVVDAILACTAPLTQILDHMARARQPLPPEKAVQVLRELLCQTLQPLAATAPSAELRAAARLIDAAAELVVDEVLLVPHAPQRRRAGTRARGRRGH